MASPTNELYQPLIDAYAHFNQYLFSGTLPAVIFTLQRKKHTAGFFAAQRWGDREGNMCSEIAINPTYFADSRIIEVMQTLVHEMVHVWQFHFGLPSQRHYHNREWADKMVRVGLMPSDTGEPGGATVGQHMSDYIIKEGEFLKVASDLINRKTFALTWVDRLALPKLREPVIAALDATPASIEVLPSEVLAATSADAVCESLESFFANTSLSSQCAANQQLPSSFFLNEVARKPSRQKYVCSSCNVKVYGKPGLRIRCEDCHTSFITDD